MKQDPGGAQIPGPISYLSHSNKINTSSLMQNIWEFDHDPHDEILMHMLSNKIRKKHSHEPIKESVRAMHKHGAIINNSRDIEMLAEYHSMIEESSIKMNSEYEFPQLRAKNGQGGPDVSNMVLGDLETGNRYSANSNINHNINHSIKQNQRAHLHHQDHPQPQIHINNKESPSHTHADVNKDNKNGIHDHKEYGISSSAKTALGKTATKPMANTMPGNYQVCNNYYRNEDILCNKIVSNHTYIMAQVRETMQLLKYMSLQLQIEEARKDVIKREIDCRKLRIGLRTASAGSALKRRSNHQEPNNKDPTDEHNGPYKDQQLYKKMQVKKEYNIDHNSHNNDTKPIIQANMEINVYTKSYNINRKFAQNALITNNPNSLYLPNTKSSPHLLKGKPYLRASRSAKNTMKQMNDKSSGMIKIYSRLSSEYKDKEKEEWLSEQIKREKEKQERLRTKEILVNNYYESLARRNAKPGGMKSSSMLNVNNNENLHKPIEQIETEQTIMNTNIHVGMRAKTNIHMNMYKSPKKQGMGIVSDISKNDPQYRQVLVNKCIIIREILQECDRHYSYKIAKLQEENAIRHNQITLIDNKLREATIECSKIKSRAFMRKRNNSKNQIKANKFSQQAHHIPGNVQEGSRRNADARNNSGNYNKNQINSGAKGKRQLMRSPSYGYEYGYVRPVVLQKWAANKQGRKWSSIRKPGLRRAQSQQQIPPRREQEGDDHHQNWYNEYNMGNGMNACYDIRENNGMGEISLELIEQEKEQYNIEYGNNSENTYRDEYELKYSSNSGGLGFDPLAHL